MMSAGNRRREIRVSTVAESPLEAGDRVELAIAPADLLRGALYAYALPLAGMVLALGIAWLLLGPLTDPVAVTVAAAGLAAAWAGCRLWLGRPRCLSRLQPAIVGHRRGAG